MRRTRRHSFRILVVRACLFGLLTLADGWGHSAYSRGPKEAESAGTEEAGPSTSLDAARALMKGGKYREAEDAARKLLEESESAATRDPAAISQSLDLLVEALWRGGKFHAPEARELAQRGISAAASAYPEADPRRAVSLTNLGNILLENREFDGARGAFESALALREKALGPEDAAVAFSLVDIGRLCEAQRDLPGARLAWSRSLAILEKSLGPKDPQTAASVSNLARVAYLEHDLATAKTLMERALIIRQETLGPDHPDTARTKTNFCAVLIDLGEYGRAEQLAREALATQEKLLGPEHPQLATTLGRLNRILYLEGKPQDAIPIQRRVLAIAQKAYGPDNPRVGMELNNLGLLLQAAGDLEGAKESLQKAMLIEEKSEGPESEDVAETLASLATLLEATGQHAQARAHAERAVQIFDSARGPDSSPISRPLDTLARIAWAQGDRPTAISDALRESRILRSQFELTSSVLTESEAMQYEAVLRRGLDMSLSVFMSGIWPASQLGDPSAAWNEVVQSRGLVLNELAARHRGSSPEVRELAASFDRARESLASLLVKGPGPGGRQEYRGSLEKARAEREAAERSLAEKSASYRAVESERRVDLEKLLSKLPDSTALVSYVLFDRISDPPTGRNQPAAPVRTTPSYLAFVFARGQVAHVRLLGESSEIDKLVESWRLKAGAAPAGLAGSWADSEREARSAGETLRRKVWDPLQHDMKGAQQVFIVPDGTLHLVNFSALPAGSTQYLLEKGPRIHYLSAERDLASSPPTGDTFAHPLIFGGADFDKGPEASGDHPAAGSANGSRAASERSTRPAGYPRSPVSCEQFHQARFEPLPGSREEAQTLAALLRQGAGSGSSNPDSRVQQRTGAEADERSFKELAPGSTLLHIATHGFFYEGDCISGVSEARRMAREGRIAGQDPKPALGDSPLLLSGLAFSGANQRLEANHCMSCDDGILTAEEIAALDLSTVDWAVLSSCDTGLGRIQAGEGVLGLRRAFHVAGAKTLIMSLWKVDDESTRQWMKFLYEGRLKGMSTAEAVRNASVSLLKARRAHGMSTHPFTWGAFVAAGDWR